MNERIKQLPRWMWWAKGRCVVEIISAGHFPNTVKVALPNDVITEVEIEDLADAENQTGRQRETS